MAKKDVGDDRRAEVDELELDAEGAVDLEKDLEKATREALAAVEGRRPDEPPADDDEDPTARLEREIADLRDRSVRTLADFENFRKRSEREREESKRYALGEPLRDLLEVVDNLELALAAEGSRDDLKLGVELILRQLRDLLRRHGVREIEAAGARFDPMVHEAVSRQEDAAVEAPTVVEELRRGYQLHDRLLRPAMVRVAVPGEPRKLN
jgi:molecular chaperone GrpE